MKGFTGILSAVIALMLISVPCLASPVQDDEALGTLSLSVEFVDDPVYPGDLVTLQIVLMNLDPTATATGIAFTGDLDAALSGLAATGLPMNDVVGAGSQFSGTSLLVLTGGELPPMGGMASFDVTLQVPPTATPGDYPFTTSALMSEGLVQAPPATDTLTVLPEPTALALLAIGSLAHLRRRR